jgi:hypothetical protein
MLPIRREVHYLMREFFHAFNQSKQFCDCLGWRSITVVPERNRFHGFSFLLLLIHTSRDKSLQPNRQCAGPNSFTVGYLCGR